MKQFKKSKRPIRDILRSLHKSQIIAIIAIAVVITGTASAATVAKVNNSRAKQEQERVLRTTNLENATSSGAKVPVTEPNNKTETNATQAQTSTSNSSTKTKSVSFTKGGASLQGSVVVVSLTASAPLNGSCYYNFTLGNSVVNQQNSVSGSACAINIPLSTFVKSGNWILNVKYVSSDSLTQGSVGGIVVKIVPEVRTISFTKGGAGQNGTIVSASSNLSESQSGTCTFVFSLNGTVRVSKTTSISNSNQCAVDIALSEFPKSATYSYTLSFISNDTLTIANQSAFDVDVM